MCWVFLAQARTVRAERSDGEFRSLQTEYLARPRWFVGAMLTATRAHPTRTRKSSNAVIAIPNA